MAGTLGAVAGLVALAGADAASGGPSGLECAYDGSSKELTVTNDQGGAVYLSVDSGDILVDSGGEIPCDGGTPTVTNVDHITVTDTGTGTQSGLGITAPATFAPGATDAGDGLLNPHEIEWTVDLGDEEDVIIYYGSGDPGGARVTFGTEGINHNVSDNSLANDADVDVTGVDGYRFEGGSGDDGMSGLGGQGTGNPVKQPFDYPGPPVGIFGSDGNDYLVGGRGNDSIMGSFNADYIAGGEGRDTASWDDAPSAVTVGIGGANSEDGGMADNSNVSPFTARDTVAADIENLLGGDFDDVLRGDGDANVLTGGLGADKLFGLGANDVLKAKDSVADLKIRCGPGKRDSAKVDAGLDPRPKSC